MSETIRAIREAADREFDEVMRSAPNFDIEEALERRFVVAKKIGAPLYLKIPKRIS